jgi:hypothetical protein
MALYYGDGTTKQVHKKTCDKSCEDRGGAWIVPPKKKK